MKTLTKSELEMLGLDNTPAPVVSRKVSTELQPYVGAFVVTDDGLYGMIDAVHGNSLGFVHAEKDSWTGQLIGASKVKIVSPTTIDGAKAFRSAKTYFNREATSLRSRIARNYAFDDKVTLNNMLTHCETWLRRIGA